MHTEKLQEPAQLSICGCESNAMWFVDSAIAIQFDFNSFWEAQPSSSPFGIGTGVALYRLRPVDLDAEGTAKIKIIPELTTATFFKIVSRNM